MTVIQTLQPIVLVIFIYATMIYLGLSITIKDIGQQFRHPKVILIGLALNLIVSPLLAMWLGQLVGLSTAALTAIVLINLFCGAPAGPKNVDLAHGNIPLAIALVAVLSLAVVLIVPFSSRLFLPDIQVDAVQILTNLLVLLVIPLAIGMLVRAFLPKVAKPLRKVETLISNIFMIAVILLFLIPNITNIINVGLFVFLVYFGIIIVSFGISYLLTFGNATERKTVSLITITKNFGVAMAIAPVAYADLDLIPYLMTYIVILLVFSLPLSLLLRKVGAKQTETGNAISMQ